MNCYFAPMEGLTGYIYRNAHHKFFGNIDKYFTPFISPNQEGRLRTREIRDIMPENNRGITVIPQILTKRAEDFIRTSLYLKKLGYEEININLGCPSPTVVSKYKGAGFLARREALNVFLEEIFNAFITDISIKTRIGMDEPGEFYELIKIYNQYPLKELIIHPRTRADFYQNKPNLAVFHDALRLSKNPVCYNGDIFSKEDYQKLCEEFEGLGSVMLGRGLLARPGLINDVKECGKPERGLLKEFHDNIYLDYQRELSGERDVLFKMKELWFYMLKGFADHEKFEKKIKRAKHLKEYEETISELFRL